MDGQEFLKSTGNHERYQEREPELAPAKLSDMMPQYPDPKLFDEKRKFTKSGPKCPICKHPKRGLIEDLFFKAQEKEIKFADVINWANYHKLFTPDLTKEQVFMHKTKHMGLSRCFATAVPVLSLDKALAKAEGMSHSEICDVITRAGVVPVLTGEVKVTVGEALKAMSTKFQIARDEAEAARFTELAKRLKAKNDEMESDVIEGEAV